MYLAVGLPVQEFDPRNQVGISAAKTYLSNDYRSACETVLCISLL